jgi:hypothetical protein
MMEERRKASIPEEKCVSQKQEKRRQKKCKKGVFSKIKLWSFFLPPWVFSH